MKKCLSFVCLVGLIACQQAQPISDTTESSLKYGNQFVYHCQLTSRTDATPTAIPANSALTLKPQVNLILETGSEPRGVYYADYQLANDIKNAKAIFAPPVVAKTDNSETLQASFIDDHGQIKYKKLEIFYCPNEKLKNVRVNKVIFSDGLGKVITLDDCQDQGPNKWHGC